jgi:hypothetical protein
MPENQSIPTQILSPENFEEIVTLAGSNLSKLEEKLDILEKEHGKEKILKELLTPNPANFSRDFPQRKCDDLYNQLINQPNNWVACIDFIIRKYNTKIDIPETYNRLKELLFSKLMSSKSFKIILQHISNGKLTSCNLPIDPIRHIKAENLDEEKLKSLYISAFSAQLKNLSTSFVSRFIEQCKYLNRIFLDFLNRDKRLDSILSSNLTAQIEPTLIKYNQTKVMEFLSGLRSIVFLSQVECIPQSNKTKLQTSISEIQKTFNMVQQNIRNAPNIHNKFLTEYDCVIKLTNDTTVLKQLATLAFQLDITEDNLELLYANFSSKLTLAKIKESKLPISKTEASREVFDSLIQYPYTVPVGTTLLQLNKSIAPNDMEQIGDMLQAYRELNSFRLLSRAFGIKTLGQSPFYLADEIIIHILKVSSNTFANLSPQNQNLVFTILANDGLSERAKAQPEDKKFKGIAIIVSQFLNSGHFKLIDK